MTKTNLPPTVLCDFYKLSHMSQYPEGTEYIYSGWIPRSNKYFPKAKKVVAIGIQALTKKYLIDYFNENFFKRPLEDVIAEYVRVLKFSLGIENPPTKHIEDLHKLGYLPILIKAVKEGTLVPIKVPMMTIVNTNKKFFWLTNFLETIISNEIWLPMTSATIAYTYRTILNEFALKTTGTTDGVEFQGHDFSMRGMGALEASMASGAGHLLSFVGTDTIPAIWYLEKYYKANIEKELVGASIPATEHSVMCAYGQTNELDLFKRLITEVYPSGFFSVVSDTWDFWKVVGEYLPKLKDEIMARDGRVVIRPDSGDPVDIICGLPVYDFHENAEYLEIIEELGADFRTTNLDKKSYLYKVGEEGAISRVTYKKFGGSVTYNNEDNVELTIEEKGLIQALWDIFGGTMTAQGYKVLDTHIGAIYGDSITIERAEEILTRLERKGFASTNIVLGIGSYSYQYNTRDTFGFAMKATYAVVNGEERMLFKDPKTDDGTKRSLRGLVAVYEEEGEITYADSMNKMSYEENFEDIDLLETVFEDGKLMRDQSLAEIREILHKC